MARKNVVPINEGAPDADKIERDALFVAGREVEDFRFDKAVARVFDDMVSRSVPFYDEMQRMVGELARDFATPNSALYDIGCATGTTLMAVDPLVDRSVDFVGIDNSAEMLDKAREKISRLPGARPMNFVRADMHQGIDIKNASVVTLILTLQFVRPLYRERVMKNIFDGLNPQGCLILVEKLTCEHTIFNRLFIDHYYDFKRRNGYSEVEIARKREALENVLIPYRAGENVELLRRAGFEHVEMFFRWYNFCGVIAVKT
jgi:tRNA (cmo5U34)-methyltransferase